MTPASNGRGIGRESVCLVSLFLSLVCFSAYGLPPLDSRTLSDPESVSQILSAPRDQASARVKLYVLGRTPGAISEQVQFLDAYICALSDPDEKVRKEAYKLLVNHPLTADQLLAVALVLARDANETARDQVLDLLAERAVQNEAIAINGQPANVIVALGEAFAMVENSTQYESVPRSRRQSYLSQLAGNMDSLQWQRDRKQNPVLRDLNAFITQTLQHNNLLVRELAANLLGRLYEQIRPNEANDNPHTEDDTALASSQPRSATTAQDEDGDYTRITTALIALLQSATTGFVNHTQQANELQRQAQQTAESETAVANELHQSAATSQLHAQHCAAIAAAACRALGLLKPMMIREVHVNLYTSARHASLPDYVVIEALIALGKAETGIERATVDYRRMLRELRDSHPSSSPYTISRDATPHRMATQQMIWAAETALLPSTILREPERVAELLQDPNEYYRKKLKVLGFIKWRIISRRNQRLAIALQRAVLSALSDSHSSVRSLAREIFTGRTNGRPDPSLVCNTTNASPRPLDIIQLLANSNPDVARTAAGVLKWLAVNINQRQNESVPEQLYRYAANAGQTFPHHTRLLALEVYAYLQRGRFARAKREKSEAEIRREAEQRSTGLDQVDPIRELNDLQSAFGTLILEWLATNPIAQPTPDSEQTIGQKRALRKAALSALQQLRWDDRNVFQELANRIASESENGEEEAVPAIRIDVALTIAHLKPQTEKLQPNGSPLLRRLQVAILEDFLGQTDSDGPRVKEAYLVALVTLPSHDNDLLGEDKNSRSASDANYFEILNESIQSQDPGIRLIAIELAKRLVSQFPTQLHEWLRRQISDTDFYEVKAACIQLLVTRGIEHTNTDAQLLLGHLSLGLHPHEMEVHFSVLRSIGHLRPSSMTTGNANQLRNRLVAYIFKTTNVTDELRLAALNSLAGLGKHRFQQIPDSLANLIWNPDRQLSDSVRMRAAELLRRNMNQKKSEVVLSALIETMRSQDTSFKLLEMVILVAGQYTANLKDAARDSDGLKEKRDHLLEELAHWLRDPQPEPITERFESSQLILLARAATIAMGRLDHALRAQKGQFRAATIGLLMRAALDTREERQELALYAIQALDNLARNRREVLTLAVEAMQEELDENLLELIANSGTVLEAAMVVLANRRAENFGDHQNSAEIRVQAAEAEDSCETMLREVRSGVSND